MRAPTRLCLRKPHGISLFQKPAAEMMAGGKRHIFKRYFSVERNPFMLKLCPQHPFREGGDLVETEL